MTSGNSDRILASEKTIRKIDRFGNENMAMDFWKWAYLIGIIAIIVIVIFGCLLINSAWNRVFG